MHDAGPNEQAKPDRDGNIVYGADLAMMRAAASGDAEACETLARRLACIGRMVAGLNARMGHGLDREDLDDVVQNVTASVWQHRGSYRGTARLEGWVHSFCDHELRNAARRKRRRLAASLPLEQEPAARSPLDTTLGDELRDCLQRLGAAEQDTIRARFYEGLNLAELAARFTCNLNTIKSRYYRSVQQLRACLDAKGVG